MFNMRINTDCYFYNKGNRDCSEFCSYWYLVQKTNITPCHGDKDAKCACYISKEKAFDIVCENVQEEGK